MTYILNLGTLFSSKAAQVVAPDVIAKKSDLDFKKCCYIVSFGDYSALPYQSEFIRLESNVGATMTRSAINFRNMMQGDQLKIDQL